MERCFETGRVPRVAGLARMLGVSREGITRAYGTDTGRSPADTFRQIQMGRARELLATTDLTTAEIARVAAFGSPRAFYRTFLHCAGMTPTEFRLRARQG